MCVVCVCECVCGVSLRVVTIVLSSDRFLCGFPFAAVRLCLSHSQPLIHSLVLFTDTQILCISIRAIRTPHTHAYATSIAVAGQQQASIHL